MLVLPKAFGSVVTPTHLLIQRVPWTLAWRLNVVGVNLTSYLHVVPKVKNVWSCTACLHGTHSSKFTFTLQVMACDNLQHVVGHVGPLVVGCCNLRLSVESYTTVATWHVDCRSQWSVQKVKYASIRRVEWPDQLSELWCRLCTRCDWTGREELG